MLYDRLFDTICIMVYETISVPLMAERLESLTRNCSALRPVGLCFGRGKNFVVEIFSSDMRYAIGSNANLWIGCGFTNNYM